MTKELKDKFEIMNTLWNLIKPYASQEDEKTYKTIMSDEFKFMAATKGEIHSDEWWESRKGFCDYPEKYRETKFVDFATELCCGIDDYWLYCCHCNKNGKEVTDYDFMAKIGKAFVNEWEKIRSM